jgi:hypothetical protein
MHLGSLQLYTRHRRRRLEAPAQGLANHIKGYRGTSKAYLRETQGIP